MARVATLLAAVLLGAAVALAGLVVHRDTVAVGDISLPWGLALGLLTTSAAVVAAGSVAGVPAAAALAAGWAGCLLLVLRGRGEGDFLLAADALGQGFTWGGLVAVGVAFAVAGRAARSPTLRR